MEKRIETHLERSAALIQAEGAIAFVLRYGVILSALIIAAGLVLRFLPGFTDSNSGLLVHQITSGVLLDSMKVAQSSDDFVKGVMTHLNADTVICLGLLVLIALPVVRVGMTVVFFIIELDWIYLGITLFVFTVLLSSIFFGKSI